MLFSNSCDNDSTSYPAHDIPDFVFNIQYPSIYFDEIHSNLFFVNKSPGALFGIYKMDLNGNNLELVKEGYFSQITLNDSSDMLYYTNSGFVYSYDIKSKIEELITPFGYNSNISFNSKHGLLFTHFARTDILEGIYFYNKDGIKLLVPFATSTFWSHNSDHFIYKKGKFIDGKVIEDTIYKYNINHATIERLSIIDRLKYKDIRNILYDEKDQLILMNSYTSNKRFEGYYVYSLNIIDNNLEKIISEYSYLPIKGRSKNEIIYLNTINGSINLYNDGINTQFLK